MEVYKACKDRVKELGIRDQVMVVRTGCLKHCSKGTAVAVWPHNHWYKRVTRKDVNELVEAAVEGRKSSSGSRCRIFPGSERGSQKIQLPIHLRPAFGGFGLALLAEELFKRLIVSHFVSHPFLECLGILAHLPGGESSPPSWGRARGRPRR